MKILVTGFDPFGGETVNPAWEAVKLLPDTVAGREVIKVQIPTSFEGSVKATEAAIAEYHPEIVLNVGQAGGRSCMTVERVAINLAEARIPDNDGQQPEGQPLRKDGENAYFSSLPVKAMVESMRAHGIPAELSYSAGTYVCNCIMYQVLYLAQKKYPGIRAGFIHVPSAAGQAVGKPGGTPFMTVDMMADGLRYALEAAALRDTDLTGANSMGTIL